MRLNVVTACVVVGLLVPSDAGFFGKGAADDERLIGWQGEVARGDREEHHGGGGSNVNKEFSPTEEESAHQKDLERGMWVEQLSWRPRAYRIHNLLTEEECDEIVGVATPQMKRSTVVDSVTGESKVDPIRTSEQTFLRRGQYSIVSEAEARIARITMLPWYNGEDMQVLKYQNGQKYDAHHDVGELTSQSGKQLAADGGQRVATVLLYLADVEEGGETAFPDSDWIDESMGERGEPWSSCADGTVAMHPKKGDGLLFWSITPTGEIDPASMHAGCPVIRGVKWTGTKWIHAGPFRYSAPPPPSAPVGCEDRHNMCKAWASSGECKSNPNYMIGTAERPGNCVWSCKKCKDIIGV